MSSRPCTVSSRTWRFVPAPDAESETTPPGQLLTGDHNLVNVRVVLSYIVDVEAVLDFV